jgi:hypothetical protein
MDDSQQENTVVIPSDIEGIHKQFEQDAYHILNNFLNDLFIAELPFISYHYTTHAGLRGILVTGKLWLTSIFALNDPSEMRHGFKLATDILEDKAKAKPPIYARFAQDFKTPLNAKFEEVVNLFVCSLCKDGDDLNLWRAYGDNGRGYVLGFETAPLKSSFNPNNPNTPEDADSFVSTGEVFQITYDDSKLVEVYGELIEKTFQMIDVLGLKHLPWKIFVESWKRLLLAFSAHVLYASLFCKNMNYGSEKEYRFLEMCRADVSADVKYRLRNNESVKYREFNWMSAGAEVLKKIVIGPAADFEKSKQFAEECLREAGIDIARVEITQSKIPYKPA